MQRDRFRGSRRRGTDIGPGQYVSFVISWINGVPRLCGVVQIRPIGGDGLAHSSGRGVAMSSALSHRAEWSKPSFEKIGRDNNEIDRAAALFQPRRDLSRGDRMQRKSRL